MIIKYCVKISKLKAKQCDHDQQERKTYKQASVIPKKIKRPYLLTFPQNFYPYLKKYNKKNLI